MSSDYDIDLTYDASSPVERLVLVPSAGFSASSSGKYYPTQVTQTWLLLPIQTTNLLISSGAPIRDLTSAVVSPSFDKTYEFAGDIAKYLLSVNGIIMFQLNPGAACTYDVSTRVVLSYQVGNQPEVAIIDETYLDPGQTVSADYIVNLKSLLYKLIPQAARMKLRLVFSATRTAGADVATVALYRYNDNQRTVSHVSLQLKPAMNSSDQVAAGIGIS